ncbi:MAG TPA: polysaccharide biosynthesis C-terminal domain-containing protein [Candidatus Limnocylindrales bacterium]|nr:polysaccharide biosynthesis C-terminal domain-containing protein [Candidatus Limnocylindrales bacterium]
MTFIGSVALARSLGPDGRGAQGFFVAATVVLSTIVCVSTPTGDYILATRRLADPRTLTINAPWLSAIGGIVAGLVMLAIGAATSLIPAPLLAVPAWPIAFAIAVAGFAFNTHQIQLALASGRPLLGAFLSFGTYALAGLGYAAVLVAHGGLSAAIWIVVGAPYATALVAAFARPRWVGLVPGRPDRQVAQRTVRQGTRFYLGELAAILHLRQDVLLLGVLAPASTVGVYVVAYQTAEPILVIASAASAAVLALGVDASATAGSRTGDAAPRLIRETFVIGALAAALAAVIAPFAIPLIYGSVFAGAAGPFLVLLPAALLLAIGRIALAELTRRNLLERTVVVSVAAVVVNLTANVILIPAFGAMGAALSSLISYGGTALLAIHYLRRDLGTGWSTFAPTGEDVANTWRAWRPASLGRRR